MPPKRAKNRNKDIKLASGASSLPQDKILLGFLFLIVLLGLYFRFVDYGNPGIGSTDAPATLSGGILWFYPHDYFPGLVHWQPPVGHFLIGLGCTLSGEDFSGVSQVMPYFQPNMAMLIGEAAVNANNYCMAPIHIFGVLFVAVAFLLALSLLNKYGAVYFLAFLAFYPFVLWWSRYMHVDIILWFFVILGLFLLWKGYSEDKLKYFMASASVFGLATATKFSAGAFFLFAVLLYTEKKMPEIKSGKKYNGKDASTILFRHLILMSILFAFFFLAPFKFNVANVSDVYRSHTGFYIEQVAFTINLDFLKSVYAFIWYLNPFDTAIFIYAAFIFTKILRKKDKSEAEKFIIYLIFFFILTGFLLGNVLGGLHIAIPFMIGIPFLMALAFSDGDYSIFRRLKMDKNAFFFSFIGIYVIYSFFTLLPMAPYYVLNTNPVMDALYDDSDRWFDAGTTQTADLLTDILKENETFFDTYFRQNILHFYLRQSDLMAIYAFEQNFKQQVGRDPTLQETITYFEYEGRKIRYILLNPGRKPGDVTQEFIMNDCTPNFKTTIKNIDVVHIYDVSNLKC